MNLIKGGGVVYMMEKVVDFIVKYCVIFVDEIKVVKILGFIFFVLVEVLFFVFVLVLCVLVVLGGQLEICIVFCKDGFVMFDFVCFLYYFFIFIVLRVVCF